MEDENLQMSVPAEETEEQMYSKIMSVIKSDPDMAALPIDQVEPLVRAKVQRRMQKRLLDKQYAAGAQSSVANEQSSREARRQEALANVSKAQAELDRDFNLTPEGYESKRGLSEMLTGAKMGASFDSYPVLAGAVDATKQKDLPTLVSEFMSGDLAKNYLAGRDKTLDEVRQAEKHPDYYLGKGAAPLATVPATGGSILSSGAGLLAKTALGGLTGAATGAMQTDINQPAGEFESFESTLPKAVAGGAMGMGGAVLGHGLQKAVQGSRAAGGTLNWLGDKKEQALDFIDEAPSFKKMITGALRSEPKPMIGPQALTDDQILQGFPQSQRAADIQFERNPLPQFQPTEPPTYKQLDAFKKAYERQKLHEMNMGGFGGDAPDEAFNAQLKSLADLRQEPSVSLRTPEPDNSGLMSKIAQLEDEYRAARAVSDKTVISKRPSAPIAESSLPQRPPSPSDAALQAAESIMDAPKREIVAPPIQGKWRPVGDLPFSNREAPVGIPTNPPVDEWVPPPGKYKSLEERMKEFKSKKSKGK